MVAILLAGLPAQVFISSALFAGSHLSAGQLLPLGALGAILGAVHIRAGRNVFAAVLSHALYNGLILLATVLSLPPPST